MNKDTYDLTVIKQITKLQSMSAQELDNIWRTMFDHEPEVNRRKYIIGKIAYRIQELAYGALATETEDKIKACAKETQKKECCSLKQKSKEVSSDNCHDNCEKVSR